jgi:hypothetical protein
MGNLPDFERGQIISVRLGAASVIKTATLLSVARATVPKVMPATSVKRNSVITSTLTERDCRTLRIVLKNHTITAAQVMAELNIHLQHLLTKTVRCEFHKSSIHSRPARSKPLITESNAQMCK